MAAVAKSQVPLAPVFSAASAAAGKRRKPDAEESVAQLPAAAPADNRVRMTDNCDLYVATSAAAAQVQKTVAHQSGVLNVDALGLLTDGLGRPQVAVQGAPGSVGRISSAPARSIEHALAEYAQRQGPVMFRGESWTAQALRATDNALAFVATKGNTVRALPLESSLSLDCAVLQTPPRVQVELLEVKAAGAVTLSGQIPVRCTTQTRYTFAPGADFKDERVMASREYTATLTNDTDAEITAGKVYVKVNAATEQPHLKRGAVFVAAAALAAPAPRMGDAEASDEEQVER